MQNVHLLQVHIQRNRAWLQKHTEGQELRPWAETMRNLSQNQEK